MSSQRSTAYYQTPAGKRKKQALNRRPRQPSSAGSQSIVEGTTAAENQPEACPAPDRPTEPALSNAQLQLGGVVLDESSLTSSPVMPYLRMMVSLIEGVAFTCEELLALLRRALRQRSIARRKRRDYVLSFLRQHPP